MDSSEEPLNSQSAMRGPEAASPFPTVTGSVPPPVVVSVADLRKVYDSSGHRVVAPDGVSMVVECAIRHLDAPTPIRALSFGANR